MKVQQSIPGVNLDNYLERLPMALAPEEERRANFPTHPSQLEGGQEEGLKANSRYLCPILFWKVHLLWAKKKQLSKKKEAENMMIFFLNFSADFPDVFFQNYTTKIGRYGNGT